MAATETRAVFKSQENVLKTPRFWSLVLRCQRSEGDGTILLDQDSLSQQGGSFCG